MIDVLKEIKLALNELNSKPTYTKKVIIDEIYIQNNEVDGKRVYEVYHKDKLKMKVNNIFTNDKDRGYAAKYIYNNLMCEGLV